jgi:hypothetical protein
MVACEEPLSGRYFELVNIHRIVIGDPTRWIIAL